MPFASERKKLTKIHPYIIDIIIKIYSSRQKIRNLKLWYDTDEYEGFFMKNKLTSLELKWILYDVGNSAFILLVTTIIPIYFNHLALQGGIDEEQYLAYWSYAASFATVLVAFLGPVMGTVADFRGNKKRIFLLNAVLGALLLFCFWMPSNWLAFLVLFVITRVFYSVSLVIYDSMLTDVAPEEDLDNVSSKGYAWGYIGSVIPFVISLVIVLMYDQIGISFNTAMMLAFAINAVWWFAFTLPIALAYKQKHFVPKEDHVAKQTFHRLGQTLRNIRHHKKAFLFLLAFFFYIDGVYTIMEMATAYGTSLGLDQTMLLLALLLTQIVAFPAAIAFGVLSKKYSTELLIKVAVIAYLCIALYALFLNDVTDFWILAFAVGLFQGGIQALSRSYFAKLIPANASGEYFGLFDICGKGASFLGTMIVGLVTQLTGIQNIAVGCLAFLFLVGLVIFSRVAKMPNDEAFTASNM